MPNSRSITEIQYAGDLRVNSTGKLWITKPVEILREKGRIDYSIFFFYDGAPFCEMSDGSCQTLEEGSMIIYPPNVRQHYGYAVKNGTIHHLWAHFSGADAAILDKYLENSPLVLTPKDLGQFKSVIEKMVLAYYKKTPLYQEICKGYMTVLLALIEESMLLSEAHSTKLSNENLEKVLGIMHLEYNQPINIHEYAKICHVCVDHFIRIFKAYTGLTPYNYQLRIRINAAMRLLESSAINVSECASIVGFSSNSYFSKVFKRLTGKSPSQYIK